MLLNILAGLAGGNEFTELLVAANNVDEDVGEIVVHPLIVLHHDRGTHGERGNGENRAHHPRGVGVLGVKPKNLDGVVGETLEAAKNHLGLERYESLLVLACELALESADGTLNLLNLLDHLGAAGGTGGGYGLGLLADEVYGSRTNVGEPFHALQFGVEVYILREPVLAGDVEAGTVDAHAVEGLDSKVEELVEVDWAGKGDVAEMALALEIRVLAGGADLAALDDTEPCIKHAAGNWIVGLMSLVGNNFHDRPPKDLLGRSDPKLNAYNGHCILIRLSRNIFYDPFSLNVSGL
jgi:hypothetical protein